MILDTNAVSAIIDGQPSIGMLKLSGSYMALPLGVVAEYLFGIAGSTHRESLSIKFAELEATCDILLPDRSTADVYAVIRHQLKLRGRPIPANDIWIAALALQHDQPILSRDAHFDAIDGVRRVGW